MKKFIVLLAVSFVFLPLYAQYRPVDGTLVSRGARVFAEGRKLTKGEIDATLSMFSGDDGIGYDVRWTRARRGYNAGIALTSIGSAVVLSGGIACGCGLLLFVAAGMTSPLYMFADGYENLDSTLQQASYMMAGGLIVALGGVAMLGAGIPLICVNKSRMKRIVNGYNMQYHERPLEPVTMNFGPTRNGIGLSLNF